MDLAKEKNDLITTLVEQRVLKTQKIIDAFKKVSRENFVLPEHVKYAYGNFPLPIYENQTISQPLTVAVITESARPEKGQNILEVGAGSGYQAAILSEIVGKNGRVTALERLHVLAQLAKKNLEEYKNVSVIECDGSAGYENNAPYDSIIVSASASHTPEKLVSQLKNKGRLVITIGDRLFCITKNKKSLSEEFIGYYSFVPLIGEY